MSSVTESVTTRRARGLRVTENSGPKKLRVITRRVLDRRARYFAEVPLEDQWRIHFKKHYGMGLKTRMRTWYERLPEALRPAGIRILKDWYQRNKEAF